MNVVRLIVVSSLLLGAAATHALEAGAAKVRVLPPPGVALDGDAGRLGRPALGEHDPLWVRCLYLHDGERAMFLVNVDAYRITPSLRALVVDRAASFAPKESIILTATHTPNGPGGMSEHLPDRWYAGRWQIEMVEAMSEAILTAMTTALDQKRRATLGYGTARPRGLSVNVLDPAGPVDDQVGVVRVDDADGKAIAILTCFAAAPGPLPAEDRYRFSAGYPGAYYAKMESLTDPGCVAMFLMGAGGDQRPASAEGTTGWAQVETVGQLLATSAKAAANDMTFHDSTFALNYREVALPETLATHLPATAILQTLEIDGLLLAFVPGLPGVGIGQELRRLALAGGFQAQFTVGLANGYLGYITPRAHYAVPRDSGAAQYYGPDFESWLYREVLAAARQEEAVPPAWETPDVAIESISNGVRLRVDGDGFERGLQRGGTFRPAIQGRFEERIAARVRSGALRPVGEHWRLWPSILDPSPLALPALGIAVRPMLQGLPADMFAEIEGFSMGAGIPFDAAWLLQCESLLPAMEGLPVAPVPSHGTMFGLLGEAGAAAPLVGLYTEYAESGQPAVTEVRPDEGHVFVFAGLDWHLGAIAGMNDTGVALCLERNEVLGAPDLAGLPAGLLVRQILQYAGTFEEAIQRLEGARHLRGYHMLLVARSAAGWRGAVVTYGKRIETRTAESGMLPGIDPDADEADPVAEQRYRTLVATLGALERVSEDDARGVMTLLADETAPPITEEAVGARCSIVMRPDRLLFQVAFPSVTSTPGEFTEIRLRGSAVNE